MSLHATWKDLRETWLLPVAEYIKDVDEREGYLASIKEMDEAVMAEKARTLLASSPSPGEGRWPSESVTAIRKWQRHWLLRQYDNSGQVLKENMELSDHLDRLLAAAPVEGQAPQGHSREYQRGFDAGGAIAMDAMGPAPQGMREALQNLIKWAEAPPGDYREDLEAILPIIEQARSALSAPVRDAGK